MIDALLIGTVAALAVTLLLLCLVLFRQQQAAAPVETPAPPRRSEHRKDEQITPAPMLDGVTLRDWLIHMNPLRDQVWPRVVEQFYQAAASVPQIADYFPEGVSDKLKQHFTRALMLVTSRGITRGTLQYLREKHLTVLNSQKQPITAEVYDAAIQALISILMKEGVPQRGIAALGQTIAPIKAEIVRS